MAFTKVNKIMQLRLELNSCNCPFVLSAASTKPNVNLAKEHTFKHTSKHTNKHVFFKTPIIFVCLLPIRFLQFIGFYFYVNAMITSCFPVISRESMSSFPDPYEPRSSSRVETKDNSLGLRPYIAVS